MSNSDSLDSFLISAARDIFEAYEGFEGGRKDFIDGAFQCLGDFKDWAVTEVLALYVGSWNPSSSFCKAMVNSIDWDSVYETICNEHKIFSKDDEPIVVVPKLPGKPNNHIHYIKYLPQNIKYELPYETISTPTEDLKVGDVISEFKAWETEDVALVYKIIRINKKTMTVVDCTEKGVVVEARAAHPTKISKDRTNFNKVVIQ